MKDSRFGRLSAIALLVAVANALPARDIPSPWSAASIDGYRLPLPGLGRVPRMAAGGEYYSLPEVNLKTYPVYTPDKEPKGYIDWLKTQSPQPLVDVSKLHTNEDWIAAGREVFYGRELPRFSGSEDNLALMRNPKAIAAYGVQITKEGVLLGLRYVVREKGKLELGTDTCAMCHVRVQPDGSLIEGPANVRTPFGALMGDLTRRYAKIGPEFLENRRLRHMREDYRVPFLKPDPNLEAASLPAEEIAKLYEQTPLGVYTRTNTSLLYPVKIANLIGIGDLKFFDRTGTARNRGIADLMRYSGSIADVSDALTEYGDGPDGKLDLSHMGLSRGIERTPDALLYALALYLESLRPPPNPNQPDAAANRGKAIFEKQGCGNCHTAPLYTNNRLTLAMGYRPSEAMLRETGAMNISAGTDPNLATRTRKATGYYRVPSLRMVWMEVCFLHDGSIGTLEELFDPGRLKPDFRSSNWPPAVKPRAVPGHTFGMNLAAADRADLIAFLKTL